MGHQGIDEVYQRILKRIEWLKMKWKLTAVNFFAVD